MRSDYFFSRKEGATSCMKKRMTSIIFERDGNEPGLPEPLHRQQKDKVVQVTCGAVVEIEFLISMHHENMQKMADSYIPMRLKNDHGGRGEERRTLEADHVRQVVS